MSGEELGRVAVDDHRLHHVVLDDGVHHVLSLDHPTEDRVPAIEVHRCLIRDEKLAAVGRGAGVGHRENARAVVLKRGGGLVLERVPRPAPTRAGRVAALDHGGFFFYPMELESIVVPP